VGAAFDPLSKPSGRGAAPTVADTSRRSAPAGLGTLVHGPPLAVSDLWTNCGDAAREALAAHFGRTMSPLLPEAEASARFPRGAITSLGDTGLMRARWSEGGRDRLPLGVVVSEELGRAGLGGIGVGISVHMESVLAVLMRFGRGELLGDYCEGALDGRLIGCIAASEQNAGSDLGGIQTTAVRHGGGWKISGTKTNVSLGGVADFALVLCRVGATANRERGTVTPSLLVAVVPSDSFAIEKRRRPVGARSLETVQLRVEADVSDEAVVGRPGRGLMIATWALTHERLASSAQVIGTMRLATSLAATHLYRRRQFGRALIEHQALRLRLADLAARVSTARHGLYGLTAALSASRRDYVRQIAATKVTVARLGERVASECMHLFGAAGYLEDESPLPRLWRDLRLARLGGGSDEMMLELTAGGLTPDDATYDALMGRSA